MGKTPKPKANAKSQSIHSRASRRAISPSLDLDKSITSLPRPETPSTNTEHSVLSTQHGSGISKKKSKSKAKTRAQRLRQEKGMERAEVILDRTEKKVTKSNKRGKTVNARRAPWDELNVKITSQKGNTMPADEDKTASEPMRDDITFATPEQSPTVDNSAEDPAQNSVTNVALDMEEDEEIT